MSLLVVLPVDPASNRASAELRQRALHAAGQQGFAAPEAFDWELGSAWWFATPQNTRGSGGFARLGSRFAAYVGTMHWRKATGAVLLERLLSEHSDPSTLPLEDISGSFVMLYSGGNDVWLVNDLVGIHKAYTAHRNRLISTSFMLCRDSVDRVHVDRLRAQEYILLGANHGLATPLDEVRLLDPTQALNLSGQPSWSLRPAQRLRRASSQLRFEAAVEAVASTIAEDAANMVAAFGSDIGMALSGGFDSRLLLAALDRVGVQPHLYVYGVPADSDVQVASAIARRLNIAIECIDKRHMTRSMTALTAERLGQNLRFFDGLPVDGAFDRGADQATRLLQVQQGRLNLNGGGGEILRNFFLLPDFRYSASDLVRAFYSNWLPEAFASPQERTRFLEMMRDSVVDCLALDSAGQRDGSDPILERSDAELVYTLLRLRYWMGRNNSIAARYGLFLTPLVSPRLVALAASLPLQWKTFGRFESAVIAALSPRVASGPSSYGFDFATGPNMAHRLHVCTTLLRPLWLRQRSASIRRQLGLTKPPSASAEWLDASAGLEQQDWLVATALTSDDQLNRMLTLSAVVSGVPGVATPALQEHSGG
jgi:hypothetical protein